MFFHNEQRHIVIWCQVKTYQTYFVCTVLSWLSSLSIVYVYACYFLTIFYILYWLSRPKRTCMRCLSFLRKFLTYFCAIFIWRSVALYPCWREFSLVYMKAHLCYRDNVHFVLNANWCWPNLAQVHLFLTIFCARIVLLFHFLYVVPDCLCLDWLLSPVSCYPVCVLHQCFIVGSCPSVAVRWCPQFSLLVFSLVLYFDITLIKHCVWIHLSLVSEFATLHIPHIIISSSEA